MHLLGGRRLRCGRDRRSRRWREGGVRRVRVVRGTSDGEVVQLPQVPLHQPGAAGLVEDGASGAVGPPAVVPRVGFRIRHGVRPPGKSDGVSGTETLDIARCDRPVAGENGGRDRRPDNKIVSGRGCWASWPHEQRVARTGAPQEERGLPPSTVGYAAADDTSGCEGNLLVQARRARPAHGVFPGGAPGRTRTCDLEIRRLLLYPAELRGPAPTAAAGRAGDPARGSLVVVILSIVRHRRIVSGLDRRKSGIRGDASTSA